MRPRVLAVVVLLGCRAAPAPQAGPVAVTVAATPRAPPPVIVDAGAASPEPQPKRTNGPSYEEAIAAHDSTRVPVGPELRDAELMEPMRNAGFVSGCGAPDSMKVTVKVAVQDGRAVGVSVYTTPPAANVADCIDRHVRGLRWAPSEHFDSFTTTY